MLSNICIVWATYLYWSEMGAGWSAAGFDWEKQRYVSLAQGGFSDHRSYFIGGTTYINPGQIFYYEGFYDTKHLQDYNGMYPITLV